MDHASTIWRYRTEFVSAVFAGVCPVLHVDGDDGTLSDIVALLTHNPCPPPTGCNARRKSSRKGDCVDLRLSASSAQRPFASAATCGSIQSRRPFFVPKVSI